MSPRSSARALALACVAACAGCRAKVTEPTLPEAWSEAEASRPLSHADCIDLALRSAPNAATWKARLDQARASLDQAGRFPNPALSIGWEDLGLDARTVSLPVQTTVSLGVALADVFSRKRRSAAAAHDLAAEEASLRAERAALAAEVARAYDELVAARGKLELEQRLAGVAESQREIVLKFVSAGLSTRLDLDRVEAELAASRARIASAGAEARALELGFEFSLGFGRPVELRLADGLTSSTEEPARDPEELLVLAAARRQEIAAATARYRAELEHLKLAAERVQFLPQVSAGPREQGGETSAVASLDFVLPVFDTGSDAERAQAAGLLAAAAELRRVAQRVSAEVWRAADRLGSAETFLADHARALAARRQALREELERLFAAGQAEFADLALARRDEVEARLALLDAELAAATARIGFDAALGRKTDAGSGR